ncbi:hypothetical protein, partial [Paraburkholderia tropica]|uniref:hypothetical protein n=1 Tax=Paraburkholderia tropica TaxID=92647 RepID=UPI002ABDBE37
GAAVGLAERSANVVVRQAATVFRSGLRLNAGVVAGGAAFVGAAFDAKDMADALGGEKWDLGGVYLLRATAQVGAGFLSVGLGMAYGAPFLRYIARKYASRWIFLESTAEIAAKLALKTAFMLRWCIRINVAIFVLSLVIEYMLPNDLEIYLDQCTFRKNRSNAVAYSEAKEVAIFQRAVENTL